MTRTDRGRNGMARLRGRRRRAFLLLPGLAPLLLWLLIPPLASGGDQKFRIEVFGGISAFNPADFNLFSKAEEQYNELFFIQRLRSMEGYFTNDLPEMRWAKPFGFRLRWNLSQRVSISLGLDGFTERRRTSFGGSFSYAFSYGASEIHERSYEPYRLSLRGFALTAGIHYRFPLGEKTDLEMGAAAGWMKASFNYSSTWTYTAEYQEPDIYFSFLDGGTLEGDGRGGGAVGRISFRLSRTLNRRLGIFVETMASLCRMASIRGGGRETRLGIPGEVTWEGEWGIKKENISLSWAADEVLVPTNYWRGWTGELRERDFVLNLSSVRVLLGFFLRL